MIYKTITIFAVIDSNSFKNDHDQRKIEGRYLIILNAYNRVPSSQL